MLEQLANAFDVLATESETLDFPRIRKAYRNCEALFVKSLGQDFEGNEQNIAHAEKILSAIDHADCALSSYLECLPDGKESVIERLLAPPWDTENDILILLGRDLSEMSFRRIAQEAGQRVILQYISMEDAETIVDDINAVAGRLTTSYINVYPTDSTFTAEEIEKIKEKATDCLNMANIATATVSEFGGRWINQGLKNLLQAAECPTIEGLKDAMKDRTLIAVGAGPSLDENISQLKSLQGKACIFSVSHAVRALLKHGIVPDIIGVVDPEELDYHLVDERLDKSFAVLGLTVNPAVWRMPFAGKFAIAANQTYDTWIATALGGVPTLSMGGFVGGLGVALGKFLGCKRIVIVGMDLSLTDGRMYSRHSVDGDTRVVSEDGRYFLTGYSDGFRGMGTMGGEKKVPFHACELPGYYGGTVMSQIMYFHYHRWLKDAALKNPEIAFVNATQGGVYIDGWQHMPLWQVAWDLRETFDPRAIIASKHVPQKRNARGFLAEVKSFLDDVRPVLEECVMLSLNRDERVAAIAKEKILGAAESFVPFILCTQRTLRGIRDDEDPYVADTIQYRAMLDVCKAMLPIVNEELCGYTNAS